MKNIIQKIKIFFIKYWLFILLISLILILSYATLRSKKKNSAPQAPNPQLTENKPPVWKNIQPGITKESDLEKNLGQPIKEATSSQGEIFYYQSDFKNNPNEVQLKDGQVDLIKEKVPYNQNLNLKSYRDQYGEPLLVMYDKNFGNIYPVYVYPEKGIALIAHSQTGSILETWYFYPTTKDKFIQTFSSKLSSMPLNNY